MTLVEFLSLAKTLWVVWLTLVFAGIVFWSFAPSRRNRLEEHARIPFRQDEI
jgi:cytochrome c oxidase cbb3-type subunit IV